MRRTLGSASVKLNRDCLHIELFDVVGEIPSSWNRFPAAVPSSSAEEKSKHFFPEMDQRMSAIQVGEFVARSQW